MLIEEMLPRRRWEELGVYERLPLDPDHKITDKNNHLVFILDVRNSFMTDLINKKM